MEIRVRWVSTKYAEVTVEISNVTIESGLLDVNEQVRLAEELREVADELDPGED